MSTALVHPGLFDARRPAARIAAVVDAVITTTRITTTTTRWGMRLGVSD